MKLKIQNSMNKIKKQQKKQQSGITLVEIIVATSILVVSLTIISGLLINIIKAQARTNASRTIYQEARNVMETITREAKLVAGSASAPSFTINNSGPTDGDELVLTNGPDVKIFKIFDGAVQLDTNDITSDQVIVTDLTFETSSKCTTDPPNVQPFVTITLIIQSEKVSDVQMTLKTTVSSRDYYNE